jgi:hypothetical protein
LARKLSLLRLKVYPTQRQATKLAFLYYKNSTRQVKRELLLVEMAENLEEGRAGTAAEEAGVQEGANGVNYEDPSLQYDLLDELGKMMTFPGSFLFVRRSFWTSLVCLDELYCCFWR